MSLLGRETSEVQASRKDSKHRQFWASFAVGWQSGRDADRTHGGVEPKAGSSAVNGTAAAKRRAIVLGDERRAVVRRAAGVHAWDLFERRDDEAKLGSGTVPAEGWGSRSKSRQAYLVYSV